MGEVGITYNIFNFLSRDLKSITAFNSIKIIGTPHAINK